jgi:hypothetical protein
VEFSPASCYFLSLTSKYSPQNRVLKYPKSMSTEDEWWSFTTRQTNRYIVVLQMEIFTFFERRGQLNWITSSISRTSYALDFLSDIDQTCPHCVWWYQHPVAITVSSLHVRQEAVSSALPRASNSKEMCAGNKNKRMKLKLSYSYACMTNVLQEANTYGYSQDFDC